MFLRLAVLVVCVSCAVSFDLTSQLGFDPNSVGAVPDELQGQIDGMNLGGEESKKDTTNEVSTVPKSSMKKLLKELEDDDPTSFGAYDKSGIVGAGTCMGGYIKELDLYLDCKKLLGFLAIMNTDLSGLEKLKKLSQIEGLKALVGPDGNGLTIKDNKKLKSLKGLGGLNLVAGGLCIEGNPKLTDMSALSPQSLGVDNSGTSVKVKNNKSVKQLPDLSGMLKKQISGTITIEENDVLNQIQGLNRIKEIDGDLNIKNNAELSNMRGLDYLTVIKGSLKLQGNPSLRDVMGMSTVRSIVGGIIASDLPSLKSFEGLHNLKKVGKDTDGNSLTIVRNSVETLNGLRGLVGLVMGAVEVSDNKFLTTLSGLEKVTTIGKNLEQVSMKIKSNPLLKDVEALSGLKGKMDGALVILENPSLHKLAGLQKLSEIGANKKGVAVQIEANDALENLIGLDGITKTSGEVQIKKNKNLSSLEGLGNLRAVSGKNKEGLALEVIGNGKLALGPKELTHLNKLAGGVKINGNKCVSSQVDAQVKALLANQGAGLDFLSQGASKKCSADKTDKTVKGVSAGDVTVGKGLGEVCGGRSGSSGWTPFGTAGLRMDLNSKKCKFASTPNYMTSLIGDSAHWQLAGVNSVYGASKQNFHVKLWHPVLRGKFMKLFAEKYGWQVNWLASTGKGSGITQLGKTGWKAVKGTKNVVYADVDVKASGFEKLPNYVVSLHGKKNHWMTQGAHAVYHTTKDHFRMFAVYPTAITPADAEKWGWQIAYAGSDDSTISGKSSADWVQYSATAKGADKALFIDVDTTKGKYPRTPVYVTSMTGKSHHWGVTGAASIYESTNQHFRVYLDHATSQEFAKLNDWRVNYFTYAQPVDCQMSDWEDWTRCSKTCGGGVQFRTRVMMKRAYFGGKCGQTKVARKCSHKACPINCKLTPWSPWSKCSKTCGTGVTGRTRSVLVLPSKTGAQCEQASEAKYCKAGPCPNHCEVGEWGKWSMCTKTCGTGFKLQSRKVTAHPQYGGFACPALVAKLQCNNQPCPRDCKVSDFGAWGECSVTCGKGIKTRSRSVITKSQGGGRICPAKDQTLSCNEGLCSRNCVVGAWGLWSDCSTTCGGGSQKRTRDVLMRSEHDGKKCPVTKEAQSCNTNQCPVNCKLTAFSKWGMCDRSCGGGMRKRTRSVITKPAAGGVGCAMKDDYSPCNLQACPLDCIVTPWSTWADCSTTCGLGKRTRAREILYEGSHGGKKCPITKESKGCRAICPVHCQVSEWSEYSVCLKTCGTGHKIRTRKVTKKRAHGGSICPTLKQSTACSSIKNCPVDCVASDWQPWGECSHSCGGGTRWSHRDPIRKAQYGGKRCPTLKKMGKCHSQKCPVDCLMSTWSAWAKCDVTCGKGQQLRTRRQLQLKSYGGANCGAPVSKRGCYAGPCPIHCKVGSFGKWDKCSKSCGNGKQRRKRKIEVHAKYNGQVCPTLFQDRFCNRQACPVDCVVSEWMSWGRCHKSCGAGKQHRQRVRLTDHAFGGKKCPALKQTKACKLRDCPVDCHVSKWADWTKCKAKVGGAVLTCGAGEATAKRTRTVVPKFGGKVCPPLSRTRYCELGPCPVHCTVSVWSPYDKCTKSCGIYGHQQRVRIVTRHAEHGGYVCPHLKMKRNCNKQACPIDCIVSKWGGFDSFPGGQTQVRRHRSIISLPKHGGMQCPGLVEQKVSGCTDHKVYGNWSACTKKCGTGHQWRNVEKIVCSSEAVMKYHLVFRNGKTCNTRKCSMQEEDTHNEVVTPKVAKSLHHVVGTSLRR
jgi:hypothetical protein